MRHIQFKERKAIRIKIGFCPKKEQVRHEAFEVAFNRFNRNTRSCDLNLYRGYRLLAIDGSSLNIALNRESETYYPPYVNGSEKGYNQFHLNALYDILNNSFTDCVIQPSPKQYEVEAARVKTAGR